MKHSHPLRTVFTRPARALARRIFGTITRVSTTEAVAALTFDDGPHPVFTPRLLEVLERHGAHATFFMVGEAAERQPTLLRRIAESGHAIGNHSWDHPSFVKISGATRRAQIRNCAKAISPYGQRLFRPPWGEQSLRSRLDAWWLGHDVICWNSDALDWEVDRDSAAMRARLSQGLKPGNIILLHDSIYRSIFQRPAHDRTNMIKALDDFLGTHRGAYEFVTVPELLRRGVPHRENWVVPSRSA